MQSAKTRAGIIKPINIHSLRHSFTRHLIDSGTDVTMIQKLPGHNDLITICKLRCICATRYYPRFFNNAL